MTYFDDVMRDCAEREDAYERKKAAEHGSGTQYETCPNCKGAKCLYTWGYCAEIGGWGQRECEDCQYAWNCEEGVTNPGKK